MMLGDADDPAKGRRVKKELPVMENIDLTAKCGNVRASPRPFQTAARSKHRQFIWRAAASVIENLPEEFGSDLEDAGIAAECVRWIVEQRIAYSHVGLGAAQEVIGGVRVVD